MNIPSLVVPTLAPTGASAPAGCVACASAGITAGTDEQATTTNTDDTPVSSELFAMILGAMAPSTNPLTPIPQAQTKMAAGPSTTETAKANGGTGIAMSPTTSNVTAFGAVPSTPASTPNLAALSSPNLSGVPTHPDSSVGNAALVAVTTAPQSSIPNSTTAAAQSLADTPTSAGIGADTVSDIATNLTQHAAVTETAPTVPPATTAVNPQSPAIDLVQATSQQASAPQATAVVSTIVARQSTPAGSVDTAKPLGTVQTPTQRNKLAPSVARATRSSAAAPGVTTSSTGTQATATNESTTLHAHSNTRNEVQTPTQSDAKNAFAEITALVARGSGASRSSIASSVDHIGQAATAIDATTALATTANATLKTTPNVTANIEAAVTATAPPLAPATEQVLNAIEPMRHRGDGSYHLKLELNPHELGRVELTIELRDGVVAVHMQADRESTQRVLEEQLTQLRDVLNQRGVATGSLDVGDHNASRNSAERAAQQAAQQELAKRGAADRALNALASPTNERTIPAGIAPIDAIQSAQPSTRLLDVHA